VINAKRENAQLKAQEEKLIDKGIVSLLDFKRSQLNVRQLEQALINLIKNAFEASDKNGQVIMQWQQNNGLTQIDILDSGIGIANLDNLFVPFYLTKEQGSGIRLIISR
jgi:signal transduction histidine kinase